MDSSSRTFFFWLGLGVMIVVVIFGGFFFKISKGTAELQLDHDGDGYCEHDKSCSAEGVKHGDCDDTNPSIHQDMPEGEIRDGKLYGDGIDNNCNSQIDEGAVDVDNDEDYFCEGEACRGSAKPGDCNDVDSKTFPGASEKANDGIDQDCDGIVDNNTRFFDDDGDGFCEDDPCIVLAKPGLPAETLVKAGDCNDSDPKIFPGVPEGEIRNGKLYGDGVDNNCDGQTDEGAVDADNDKDGFCKEEPCGEAGKKGGDCNDNDKNIFPGAPELVAAEGTGREPTSQKPDGKDNDCDGVADNHTEFFDDDGDGFCERKDGTCVGSAVVGDCNDTDAKVFPDAPEGDAKGNGNGLDNDCDGVIDEDTSDFDSDGDKQSKRNGDCHDTNPLIFKGAREWFDGFDNDCDGKVDEADGLAKLTDLPETSDKVTFGKTFNVYPSAIFDKRTGWAYDYGASMATIDFASGQVRLIDGREKVVEWSKDEYTVESILPPYMALRKKSTKNEIPPLYLLRFEQRQFPIRVAVSVVDPPRPGLKITAGLLVDGVNFGGFDKPILVILANGVAPLTNLKVGHEKETTIFFNTCEDADCKNSKPLGQLSLTHIWPVEDRVTVDREVDVKVEQVEVHDLVACNKAYEAAKQEIFKNGQLIPFQRFYLDLEEACSGVVDFKKLPFTIIFMR